jgi:membrane protein
MSVQFRAPVEIFKEAALSWRNDNTPRLGAALAYYTVFAIAPLFLIVLHVSSLWFGEDAARHELFGQVQGLLGTEGGKAIESLVTAAANKPQAGWWATCIAMVTFIVAATGVFVELQGDLNIIWKVQRSSSQGILQFVKDRLLSFAMVLGIGFLLLVSLVISAGLAGVGEFVHGNGGHLFWGALNFTISLGIITVLFAMILKVLPDVKIAWRDVWVGGFLTAVLFNLGKFLLGFYLGRSSVTSAYGAAGSLVIILLWVYYSSQILFFGAELTRVYAIRHGSLLRSTKNPRIHKVSEPSVKLSRQA